jgi:hypothetical protein
VSERTFVDAPLAACANLRAGLSTLQLALARRHDEIQICREQCELVVNAQLCEQGINGADLNPSAPALIS